MVNELDLKQVIITVFPFSLANHYSTSVSYSSLPPVVCDSRDHAGHYHNLCFQDENFVPDSASSWIQRTAWLHEYLRSNIHFLPFKTLLHVFSVVVTKVTG
jgi:hypothetical protein